MSILSNYEENSLEKFKASAPGDGEVTLLMRGGMKFGNEIYTSTNTGSWDSSEEDWAADGVAGKLTSWSYQQASEPLEVIAICASYKTKPEGNEPGQDNTTNLNSCQSIVISIAGNSYVFTVIGRTPHESYVYLEVQGPEITLEDPNQSIGFSIGVSSAVENRAKMYIGTYFEDGEKIGYNDGHFDDAIIEENEWYESTCETLEVEIGSVTKTYYIWKKNEGGELISSYTNACYLLTEDLILPSNVSLYNPYLAAYFMGNDASGTYFKTPDQKLHYPVSQSGFFSYGGYTSSLDEERSMVRFGSTAIQLPDDFDPILNNVMTNTQNSHTKVVEIINRTGEEEVVLETPASIPDSFYTAITNTSGRYLGTKNAHSRYYVGSKKDFSYQNYEILYAASRGGVDYIQLGEDDPFFSVQAFSGSVFVSGSNTGSIHSISNDLSNMEISVLAFAPGKRYEIMPVSSSSAATPSEDEEDPGVEDDSNGEESLTGDSIIGMVVETTSSTLPKVGDIIYNSLDDLEHRVTEALIYVPEIGRTIRTNKYGIVETYTNL